MGERRRRRRIEVPVEADAAFVAVRIPGATSQIKNGARTSIRTSDAGNTSHGDGVAGG
jgi:hypothetical protein